MASEKTSLPSCDVEDSEQLQLWSRDECDEGSRDQPTPALKTEQPHRRAVLRRSGTRAKVGALVLYAEGDQRSHLVLERSIALLNDNVPLGCESGLCAPLSVSEAGLRLDHTGLSTSIRVRGGTPDQSRALIAEIAERWNASIEDPTMAAAWATKAEIPLHRFHLALRGDRMVLDHDELPLSAKLSGAGPNERRLFGERLVVAWNMAEGWPTTAACADAVRDLDDAVLALVALHDEGREVQAALARVSALLKQRNSYADVTHGRTHDCPRCIQRSTSGSSPVD